MLVDFKIISIFQNFSQICSSIGMRMGIGTLSLVVVYSKGLHNKVGLIND